MMNPFTLKKTVASNTDADGNDILNTKTALNRLGHFDMPRWGLEPYPSADMFNGLRAFQAEEGLTVDGLARPGGETERAIRKRLGDGGPKKPVRVASADGWSRPTAWALKEAGRAVGGTLGLSETKETPKPAPPPKPKKPKIQWNDRAEPQQFSGRQSYKTNSPIKIERWSHTFGSDGIRFEAQWYPLGADGKRMPGSKPVKIDREGGGPILPTGLLSSLGFEPRHDVLYPPSENSHGWELEIEIPPQPAYNGNSAGAYLRAYRAKNAK